MTISSVFVLKDVTVLEDRLARKDFGGIIDSPELFWLNFCNQVSKLEESKRDIFSVSREGCFLTISGKRYGNIYRSINEIRMIFAKNLEEKKDFTIVFVEVALSLFIREKADVIDLKDWLNDRMVRCFYTDLSNYIKPCMKELAETVGAVFSEKTVSQRYITGNSISGTNIEKVDAFAFEWLRGEHFVYPIPALKIPARESLAKSAYGMYQNKTLCDLKLVAEGGSIDVHSLCMFTYGGEVMQKLLTCGMKESLEKEIRLEGFSLDTVRAFVDFVYLGEAGLSAESVKTRNLNLVELFEMAHTYQLQDLVDCSTNLLSLFATSEDVDQIKVLADSYENEHLKKLVASFK